jgi:hypothetical protein
MHGCHPWRPPEPARDSGPTGANWSTSARQGLPIG